MRNSASNEAVPPAGGLKRAARYGFLALTLFLCACSLFHREPTPALPVHFVHQDGFDVTWREQQDGPDLLFYGVLRNNTDLPLQNLTLTVYLLDDRGSIVDSRTISDFPMVYRGGASHDFSVRVPCPPGRVGERALLELRYVLPNSIGPSYGIYQSICFQEGGGNS